MSNAMEKTYNTRRLIYIVDQFSEGRGPRLDRDRLTSWHSRGIIPAPSGSEGKREYSFAELAFIASMVIFARYCPSLRQAREAAVWHTKKVMAWCTKRNPEELKTRGYAVFCDGTHPDFNSLEEVQNPALAYGGALLVHPANFASQLWCYAEEPEEDDAE